MSYDGMQLSNVKDTLFVLRTNYAIASQQMLPPISPTPAMRGRGIVHQSLGFVQKNYLLYTTTNHPHSLPPWINM